MILLTQLAQIDQMDSKNKDLNLHNPGEDYKEPTTYNRSSQRL